MAPAGATSRRRTAAPTAVPANPDLTDKGELGSSPILGKRGVLWRVKGLDLAVTEFSSPRNAGDVE